MLSKSGEVDNPLRHRVPCSLAEEELFVGRSDIGGRIEQLLLDHGDVPDTACSQRGQNLLLNGPGAPAAAKTVVPLFVDLQGPASMTSESRRAAVQPGAQHDRISTKLLTSLPGLSPQTLRHTTSPVLMSGGSGRGPPASCSPHRAVDPLVRLAKPWRWRCQHGLQMPSRCRVLAACACSIASASR